MNDIWKVFSHSSLFTSHKIDCLKKYLYNGKVSLFDFKGLSMNTSMHLYVYHFLNTPKIDAQDVYPSLLFLLAKTHHYQRHIYHMPCIAIPACLLSRSNKNISFPIFVATDARLSTNDHQALQTHLHIRQQHVSYQYHIHYHYLF